MSLSQTCDARLWGTVVKTVPLSSFTGVTATPKVYTIRNGGLRTTGDTMKVRFFRIVWVLSILWLGFLLYNFISAIFSNAIQHQGDTFSLIYLSLPAALGLCSSYVFTGSFYYPKEPIKYF